MVDPDVNSIDPMIQFWPRDPIDVISKSTNYVFYLLLIQRIKYLREAQTRQVAFTKQAFERLPTQPLNTPILSCWRLLIVADTGVPGVPSILW